MTEHSAPRFHVVSIPAPSDQEPRPEVQLSPGEAHHAMHVLRLRQGQEVELFDGSGTRAPGRIALAGRGRMSVAIQAPPVKAGRPEPRVALAFATPKGKRLDWLLEKATELGAWRLCPVAFQRSVAGGSELAQTKRDRWLVHCIAAAKQCGLDFLPEICDPQSPEQLAAELRDPVTPWGGWPGGPFCLMGDTSEGAVGLPGALDRRAAMQPILVLVGPEGGLTAGEQALLGSAGFDRARLGHTTLRIETAALGMLAAVNAIAVGGTDSPAVAHK